MNNPLKISQTQIEVLYKRFGSMVYARCFQMLRNEDDAVEAMQDVFVKLLRKGDLTDELSLRHGHAPLLKCPALSETTP